VRSWGQSTFVFMSTNLSHEPGCVETSWLPVMAELERLGATVHFIVMAESPLAEPARRLGVTVAPYILDKWNIIRSRSRLRKYLRRYQPVVAHSTGLEADLLLRWAARRVPEVAIATTIADTGRQATRRRSPVDALMRRFDETGITRSAAVFVGSEETIGEVQAAGVPVERVVLDPLAGSHAERDSVARHIGVYLSLMAGRGSRG